MEMPSLRRVMFFIAVAKAAVAGAGVGLALLGATDLAFMATAAHWWQAVRPDSLMNTFAIGGSVAGIAARVLNAVV